MPPVALWGQTVIETDVDRAVIQLLRLWLPTYLRQTERDRNLPAHLLARPVDGAFTNALEDDTFPDEANSLPAILVTTANTEETQYRGDHYDADWRVAVSAVVRGRTPPESREVAAVFNGCIRRILRDQPLPDLEARALWRSGGVQPVADTLDVKGRYLAAGMNLFTVQVDEVMSGEGPIVPGDDDPPYEPPDPGGNPDQEYDPLATVGAVHTTILPMEE